MKKVNCLTRSLWHWDKYGGTIVYDCDHAKVINSTRVYHDSTQMTVLLEIEFYGLGFMIKRHSDFLNKDEMIILKRYFDEKTA